MASIEKILEGKFPAKKHARRVADWIASNGGKKEGILYLEAQKLKYNEDNDQHAYFRQRRYFFYLSGCELPDCYLTYSMAEDKLTLFIPPIDPEDVVWSGLPLSAEEALKKYDVDAVLTSTEINGTLAQFASTAQGSGKKLTIYAIPNQVSEQVTFLPFDAKDFSLLKPAIDICRVVKSEYELALIRHANEVTGMAHTAVMKAAKSATNERELEALFLKTCIENGCREQAYSSIVASGTSAATLHYVKNDAPLSGKLNLLLDAGAEDRCYASDVTRTFPLGGKPFTKESKDIYDLVLTMQKNCIGMMHAGVLWEDVHSEAHKIAIKGLLEIGLLKGGSVDEIFKNRTSVAFFPHGLGHYLGMDTHDTGGNPNYQDKDPLFKYLRVRGTLPEGCVITVEPGVYFCRFIIEPYLKDELHSKYIDAKVLEKYWEVGGVRIEDNILVTKDGFVNLTNAPKETAEVETLIKG